MCVATQYACTVRADYRLVASFLKKYIFSQHPKYPKIPGAKKYTNVVGRNVCTTHPGSGL